MNSHWVHFHPKFEKVSLGFVFSPCSFSVKALMSLLRSQALCDGALQGSVSVLGGRHKVAPP